MEAVFLLFFILFWIVWIFKIVCGTMRTINRVLKHLIRGGHKRRTQYVDYRSRIDRNQKKRRRPRRELNLKKVARRLRGELDKNFDPPVIMVSRKGFQYRITTVEQKGLTTIRVTSSWPTTQFRMFVYPVKRKTSYKHVQDWKTGFDQFDREFIVEADSVKQVATVLSRRIVRRIQKHASLAHDRMNIAITGGLVEFGGKATRFLKESQVVAIVNNFMEIHREMWASWDSTGIGKVDEKAGGGMAFKEHTKSVCLVCGIDVVDSDAKDSPPESSPLEGVECRVCGTRHHRECWEWIGHCSTYGCPGRRFR